MRLSKVSPMLYTRDLRKTVEFYTSVLGFVCDALNEDSGWASVKRDNVEIMFALPNDHLPFDKPMFTGSIYFYPDNIDEVWEKVKSKAEICYPIEDFDYGMREFAILDNNGYMLQFGQALPGDKVLHEGGG